MMILKALFSSLAFAKINVSIQEIKKLVRNSGTNILKSIIFVHFDPSIFNSLVKKGIFIIGNSTLLSTALTPAQAVG